MRTALGLLPSVVGSRLESGERGSVAATGKAARKKATARNAPGRKGRFLTTQDRYEWFEEEYVHLYDADMSELARVTRYDGTHELKLEKFRKRIPREALIQLAFRAIFVLDPFRDGTPLAKAKKIPRDLKWFVDYHVKRRAEKAELKARKEARARERAAKAKKKGKG
jgi:hypothetical protein